MGGWPEFESPHPWLPRAGALATEAGGHRPAVLQIGCACCTGLPTVRWRLLPEDLAPGDEPTSRVLGPGLSWDDVWWATGFEPVTSSVSANPGNRCATRHSCRSRPTVDAEGKRSLAVQINALLHAQVLHRQLSRARASLFRASAPRASYSSPIVPGYRSGVIAKRPSSATPVVRCTISGACARPARKAWHT